MASRFYSLADILASASVHPFYSAAEYPSTPEAFAETLAAAKQQNALDLKSFPLMRKERLYQTIQRLSSDTSPRNGYRLQGYISVTGGGSGGVPMMFVTDSAENRRHRNAIGALVKDCGLIEPGDLTLSMHISGSFYRALDLVTEIVEQAGGGVFCAGHYMSHDDVVRAVVSHRINVVAGDGSQMVQIAAYIASLPAAEREAIKITKILYTSEPLIRTQRAFIRSILGPVTICSIMGSSEAGAWAVANLDLTGDTEDDHTEFIYDTRAMLLEVLPPSVEDTETPADETVGEVPEGQPGIIVQTSLQRLRHPLVRYVSGDLGSVHPLPPAALAKIPAEEAQHMKLLRLYGRDRRFSFKWFAEYFSFSKIEALMRTEEYGILQWQIVHSYTPGTPEIAMEVRLFRPDSGAVTLLSRDAVVERIQRFFGFLPINAHLLTITFVQSDKDFERSKTGNKVIKFVDRTKAKPAE
ncbi:predicted protein [Uncinocarpus reesii 1704]|uniref:AMP-dependent synthetase/ligase domain-containing protein n=1 Tax=Uncinocarpus reesii (strain UAMH 1704) TaxID=336963 RepID=C4JUF5_UNCRE|nr:uncharacterized protein UREG_04758 [Uncinocarpus reesii 1704]EEP79916.1 predicted protein [Uncinocarpus reesii 1704]